MKFLPWSKSRDPVTILSLSAPHEERGNPLENPSVSLNSPSSLQWLDNGRVTDAGEVINDVTALKIGAVYSCVRILSESVASLPLRLMRVTPAGEVRELQDPLYYLLGVAPNVEMTSYQYWQTVVLHMSLTGNSFSEIERSNDGTAVGLWPLNPRLTRAIRLPNGDLAFETQDGQTNGSKRVILAKDCLHIALMGWDGLVGFSPIQNAARTLGLLVATEKYGSRFFANNATPNIILKTTGKMKPETKAQARADWEELQSGGNQHRVAIIDQDMSVQQISISPNEAQFLESRVRGVEEVASIFRVPAHMISSTQKITNSNMEQLNSAFITDTLRPLLTSIEASIAMKILPNQAGQIATLAARFDLSERQRGDSAAIAATVACGRQWGALTANEARIMLNKPALDEPAADVIMVPVNMQNIARLLDPPKPATPTETVVTDETPK